MITDLMSGGVLILFEGTIAIERLAIIIKSKHGVDVRLIASDVPQPPPGLSARWRRGSAEGGNLGGTLVDYGRKYFISGITSCMACKYYRNGCIII